jgi:4-hydroxythreonine-4-phosphate dehydrogenase
MPDLILTLGDPNGLGPQLVSRIPTEKLCPKDSRLILIGPESCLTHHCQKDRRSPFWEKTTFENLLQDNTSGIKLLQPEGEFKPAFGRATINGGLLAGQSLELACSLLSKNLFSGLITAPLNKSTLNRAGFNFPGHTEFLAEYSGVGKDNVCMHLCGDRLRVSLATTHPRLRDVPDMITRDRVLNCLRLTSDFLHRITPEKSRIAVCGLNPHAGESGQIGTEEREIIRPAIEIARQQGINAEGPFPGDTIFYHAARGEYEAVLAMYHDQGLAPLTLLHFKQAVNVTLGLPFVRTSVDHGTGYDLVHSQNADPGSLEKALDLAATLSSPAH